MPQQAQVPAKKPSFTIRTSLLQATEYRCERPWSGPGRTQLAGALVKDRPMSIRSVHSRKHLGVCPLANCSQAGSHRCWAPAHGEGAPSAARCSCHESPSPRKTYRPSDTRSDRRQALCSWALEAARNHLHSVQECGFWALLERAQNGPPGLWRRGLPSAARCYRVALFLHLRFRCPQKGAWRRSLEVCECVDAKLV